MEDRESEGFRWDWVTFMVVLLIVVIVAVVTFEFWVSHGPAPHID